MSFNHNEPKSNLNLEVTAYLGHIISPTGPDSFDDFPQGALIVDQKGVIVAAGPWSELKTSHAQNRVVDYGQKLLLPGFVDLHVHLAQIAQAGRAGDTLLGWLTKYIFPEETKFSQRDHATRLANWFFRELAANGTTLSCVFTSIHKEATDIAFQTAADLGLRVVMGKVMMDINSPPELTESKEQSLIDAEELCKRWHGHDNNRLLYAFTPRFAPTSSSEVMSGVGKLWSKYPGSYMQTHLSENTDELRWIKELFPNCKNYLDVYTTHGLVGKNSLFAHAIHLDNSEIAVLRSSGASVAHCPSSNFFLKSGVFPYKRMTDATIPFGLGSDVAGGPEISMFKVMRDAVYIQPQLWLSPAQLLYLATLAGAAALNLQDKVGSLSPGKEADFIVVDPSRKTSVPADVLERPTQDILSALVYLGDDRMIASTFVRGKNVYDGLTANPANPEASPMSGALI